MVFDNFLSILLGWTKHFGDIGAILIISFLLTLLVNLATKFLSDQNLMKSLKEESKTLQDEMKKFKDNPQKYMEIQKKAMESNFKYMAQSFKPMAFTLIPLLIIFGWLGRTFSEKGTLINLPFTLPLIGSGLGWLGTYIISSIIFNIILRKFLKVH